MPIEIIPTFIMYSAVSAITPGPANLCSLASAISYGRKKALRQWRGIFTGFAVVSVTISVVVWFISAILDLEAAIFEDYRLYVNVII